MTLQEYMDSGNYLPDVMRDFHDAKDLFKTIHQTINIEGHEYAKDISWVDGQCYVIDIFLWYMARRGYKLQKSRSKVDFRSLENDLEEKKQIRTAVYSKHLNDGILQAKENRK